MAIIQELPIFKKCSFEEKRIKQVYLNRDTDGKQKLYEWYHNDTLYVSYRKSAVLAKALINCRITNLYEIEILDVGCGKGNLLRMILDWGANPNRIHGVDLLDDRIRHAKKLSPSGIDFQVNNSWPLPFSSKSMDLGLAFTVFSSILDKEARKLLADEITRVIKPEGIILIFDYVISDPKNPNTIGVNRKKIKQLFPNWKIQRLYPLIMPPPILRKLPQAFFWMALAIESLFPFICTHRLFVLSK